MLESLTFFGVSMENFGIFEGLFGPFVLISFRSYDGILISLRFVINTMVLQNLQDCASYFRLQNYASQQIFKNSRYLSGHRNF
jgi:hypothetical protein